MKTEDKFASVKAVFFDASDTLYTDKGMEDAYPYQSAALLARTRDIPHEEAERLIKEAMVSLQGTVGHISRANMMAKFGFSRDQVHEEYSKINPRKFLTEDKELETVMASLTKKYTLGIISNNYKAHLIEIIDALGVSQRWFKHLITADTVKEIKPDPEPFLKAIELSECAPEECVYVGDSPTKDMRPAKEAGMMTVLVKKNPSEKDMMHADAVISSVKDIITLL